MQQQVTQVENVVASDCYIAQLRRAIQKWQDSSKEEASG